MDSILFVFDTIQLHRVNYRRGFTVAIFTLIIENGNGDRGELVVNSHVPNRTIVSWVLFRGGTQPLAGVPLPTSIDQARRDFQIRFGTPRVPRAGGTSNSWAAFRCSGCLTPIQSRRNRPNALFCPAAAPVAGPANATTVVPSLYFPFRVPASNYVGNGVCW